MNGDLMERRGGRGAGGGPPGTAPEGKRDAPDEVAPHRRGAARTIRRLRRTAKRSLKLTMKWRRCHVLIFIDADENLNLLRQHEYEDLYTVNF